MEKDTENQILEELRSINKSLEHLNRKIDGADDRGDEKPGFLLWDVIKSLLIGIFIVGPALAVTVTMVLVLYSWFFG